MNKFHKAISILENYGFNFVDNESEANIIIKTPRETVKVEGGKMVQKYKVIRATHHCKTQIELVSYTLLDLFDAKEDREFIEKFGFGNYDGKLGENDFHVRLC